MKLTKHDLYWIWQRLPAVVRDALQKRAGTVFVAGGFIRACVAGEKISDIDLFVQSHEAGKELAKVIAGETHHVFESENAYTIRGFGLPIQIIHRWTFATPEECVASFDFTIASAAVWWDGQAKRLESCAHEGFYADLAAKRLVYLSPVRNEDAGGSMLRVLKFYQRGYRIPLDSLGAVIARLVSGVDHKRIEEVLGRFGGNTELATGHVVTGLLREVDPLVDPSHAFHDPTLENEPDDREQWERERDFDRECDELK